jgi:hypothetical protein
MSPDDQSGGTEYVHGYLEQFWKDQHMTNIPTVRSLRNGSMELSLDTEQSSTSTVDDTVTGYADAATQHGVYLDWCSHSIPAAQLAMIAL